MEYAIAVIDIGMTNKKVAVYDDSLRQLDAKYRIFEPKMVDGLPCHDLEAMEEWFIAELAGFAGKFPIKALTVTAHGATFVCVGKDGKPAVPCVYYTHEPGEDFHRRFYGRFGKPEALQARTGTPAFKAMINPAKGLFFSQEQFGEGFKNVTAVLPYPQYWSYRFTGKMGIESTYMGNHTYLWDQVDSTFSTVARDLGVAALIPALPAEPVLSGRNSPVVLRKSWDTLGTISAEFAERTGLPKETIVTMGIHDSNAALLPHFAKKGERGFILNSTGTWCVIMNPVTQYGFAPDELGKVVLFNISAFGAPIKTAIFLGGLEFETWSELFMKRYGRKDVPGWDEALYRSTLKEKRLFLLPELTPGSGQFPLSRARIVEGGKSYYFDARDSELTISDYGISDHESSDHNKSDYHKSGHPGSDYQNSDHKKSDYERLIAALRISLVIQTLTALERAGIEKGCEVYTEGGFRKDESYSRLFASALPDNRVFLTDIDEATALGAAMTAKIALGGKSLKDLAADFTIDYREQEKGSFPELAAYREAWLAEVGKGIV
ncbi:MAG: carbohydrate kinase [Treponema sp.]|jgi:sugar (pentulose or hexulose) kinase|nr:carbohydrate kinase [Treponema sp.]